MKSPFRKARGLGLHKQDNRQRQRSFTQLDELSQASQDMQDMRDCYDSLLSAAATTTNNAYGANEDKPHFHGSTVIEVHDAGMPPRLSLPIFGLAVYNFKSSDWTQSGIHGTEKVNSMVQSTENWLRNLKVFADKQIVRVQETPDEIPEGGTPHTVSLLMHDKLVDSAKPGDRIEITGIYRAMSVRVGQSQRTVKSLFKTYIDCLHIKKTDNSRINAEEPMETDENSTQNDQGTPMDYEEQVEKLKELSKKPDIYELLTRSLAPNIWELDDVKKGLLCQLFGGSALTLQSRDIITFSSSDSSPSLHQGKVRN